MFKNQLLLVLSKKEASFKEPLKIELYKIRQTY